MLPTRLLQLLVKVGKWADRQLVLRKIADFLQHIPPPGTKPDPILLEKYRNHVKFGFTGIKQGAAVHNHSVSL